MGRDISKDDPLYDPSRLRGPNVWPDPQLLPDFRPTMEDWHQRLTAIGRALAELMGKALQLESSYFEPMFAEPIATLRLLHYSQRESDPSRGIFACGAHTDFGFLTLLMTDEHPGLQIYHDNEWIDVPPRPGSFVVNIGGEWVVLLGVLWFLCERASERRSVHRARRRNSSTVQRTHKQMNTTRADKSHHACRIRVVFVVSSRSIGRRHAGGLDQRTLQEHTPPGCDHQGVRRQGSIFDALLFQSGL